MNNFRNTGRLIRDGDPITEFESDAKTYPRHFGKLYIEGNWFSVEQARELRDFLNQILPEEPFCSTASTEGEVMRGE